MTPKTDLIFGMHAIIEAIKAGKNIDRILLKKGASGDLFGELFGLIRQSDISYQMVPSEKPRL